MAATLGLGVILIAACARYWPQRPSGLGLASPMPRFNTVAMAMGVRGAARAAEVPATLCWIRDIRIMA